MAAAFTVNPAASPDRSATTSLTCHTVARWAGAMLQCVPVSTD